MHVRLTAATGTNGIEIPTGFKAYIPGPSRLTVVVELTPLATQQGCDQPAPAPAERK